MSWHSNAYVERVQVHLRAQHASQLALQQEAHDALQRPVRRAAQHAAGRCADPLALTFPGCYLGAWARRASPSPARIMPCLLDAVLRERGMSFCSLHIGGWGGMAPGSRKFCRTRGQMHKVCIHIAAQVPAHTTAVTSVTARGT